MKENCSRYGQTMAICASHNFGRFATAHATHGQAAFFHIEVSRRMGDWADPELVRMAVDDAIGGRQPQW
jgi:hypothetical protein